ncbi:hypothetical protein [Nocardia niigatensis]|uniref:hypothetical protein n=1 Tax=Nocardia niigatensis TaxID=209249 RepID=UPI000593F83B|nr:hypothetical protein [Nocardia niigatensis]
MVANNNIAPRPAPPATFARGAFGIAVALVAPVMIAPAAVVLLVFGHHSDPDGPAPTAVLVSDPTGKPCVMFCDEPAQTSDTPMPTPDPATLCPPFCEFERW